MEKSVVEEVAERLLDARGVGFGDERFRVDDDRAPGVTLAACRACCDGADELVEVDRLGGERQRTFFDLGEREEVVGEAADAPRFVERGAYGLAGGGVEVMLERELDLGGQDG